jgi:hypothetical protein
VQIGLSEHGVTIPFLVTKDSFPEVGLEATFHSNIQSYESNNEHMENPCLQNFYENPFESKRP